MLFKKEKGSRFGTSFQKKKSDPQQTMVFRTREVPLLLLLPFACHAGRLGSARPSLQAQDPTDDVATGAYGAEFASTFPLVGETLAFDWRRGIVATYPKSACAALEAAIDRHGFWFEEGPTSQQAEERLFMKNVTRVLCADPGQSDDDYTGILHGMLRVVRDAITRHVNSAFYIKAVAAHFGDGYNISQLVNLYSATTHMQALCRHAHTHAQPRRICRRCADMPHTHMHSHHAYAGMHAYASPYAHTHMHTHVRTRMHVHTYAGRLLPRQPLPRQRDGSVPFRRAPGARGGAEQRLTQCMHSPMYMHSMH